MAKNRVYTFTLNNPDLTKDELLDKIKEVATVSYCIIGSETGELGTYHYQGYIRFMNAIEFETVRLKIFEEKAHIEIARNDDTANYKYCSKQGDFIEYGERNCFKDKVDGTIIEDILNGMSYKDLIKKYYAYVLYHYKDFRELYHDIKYERVE